MRRHLGDEEIAACETRHREERKPSWSHARKFRAMAVVLGLLAIGFPRSMASDHADPTSLANPDANITDLFFFPKDDRMILVLDVRRALKDSAPDDLNLEAYVYEINMDFTTPLRFANDEDRARYGGTIDNPEQIHADATIRLLLTNKAKLKEASYNGTRLKGTKDIDVFVGVKDDPFIFPRFFYGNTVAMVISIPMTSFPEGQRDFILWATTSKGNQPIDHVGRSIRTQLPRFGFLNGLPPSQHKKRLMEEQERWNGWYDFFFNKKEGWSRGIAELIKSTFLIRRYDLVPDVMIYSNRFPAGYPNGRLLTDDVVAQTCATGDCLLQELSYFESEAGTWPRATTNEVELPDKWPYLAEPVSISTPPAAAPGSIWWYIIVGLLAAALVFWGLVEIVRRLILWLWRRLRRPSASPA